MITQPARGEIWYANLGNFNENEGSEQSGERGVVILSNDIGNRYSSTVICAAISSVRKKMPTHVPLDSSADGVLKDSYVLMEQIRTISKTRLKKKLSKVHPRTMSTIEDTLMFSCGITLKHPNQ